MKKIIVTVFLIYSIPLYSQLYFARKGWQTFYVEINKDSSRVEQYFYNPPDFNTKLCDEILFANKHSGDTIFIGNINSILKIKKTYYLLCRPKYSDKIKKLKLKICELDDRKRLRKTAYATDKRVKIMHLQDSLDGPDNSIYCSVNNPIRAISIDKYSESEYMRLIDSMADSLIKNIALISNPESQYYYKMIDSLNQIDSTKVFDLLAKANYKYYYGQLLLYKLALQKPEYLIRYIDRKPLNNHTILREIRNHIYFKEILKKVKATYFETHGKKQILKQKRKRLESDIAVTTVFVGIIMAEVSLVTMFFVWIL